MTLEILALLFGPLIGIGTIRIVDHLVEKRSRKLEIFRSLFLTRGLEMTEEHLKAFNIIPLEFSKEEDVMVAWKDLMDHYDKPEWNQPENKQKLVLQAYDKRDDLIACIAKHLKLSLPEKSSHKKGYIPKWLSDLQSVHTAQNNNIYALNQMLYGMGNEEVGKDKCLKVKIITD